MSDKHAYLIIAHHEPQVLSALLDALDDVRNDIFLHVDRRAVALRADVEHYRPERAGFCLLPAPLEVCWGDISQVKAEYLLLEAAVARDTYAYYHLLSGVDLPLKTQDAIHEFFDSHAGREFVGFWQSDFHQRDLDRKVSRYYVFTKYLRPKDTWRHALTAPVHNLVLAAQKLTGYRRPWEMDFKKGPQWFSITHAFCLYLLSRKDFVLKRFAHTLCPDELFVQSVLWNSPFRTQIYKETDAGCMRLIDWERGTPHVWQAADFDELARTDKLFARKFCSSEPELLDRVTGELCGCSRTKDGHADKRKTTYSI